MPGPVYKGHKVGDKVVQATYSIAVGVILKKMKVLMQKTRVDKSPTRVQKFLVRFTYDNGLSTDSYVQEKYLKPIPEKEYKAFFKKHKIKEAVAYNMKHDEEE